MSLKEEFLRHITEEIEKDKGVKNATCLIDISRDEPNYYEVKCNVTLVNNDEKTISFKVRKDTVHNYFEDSEKRKIVSYALKMALRGIKSLPPGVKNLG